MKFKILFNNEYLKFLFVGVTTVILDYIFYRIFSSFFSIDGSKIISFAIGTIYSYNLNKNFTFQIKKSKIIFFFKFILIYIIGLFINVTINKFTLFYLAEIFYYKLQLAFLIATISSAIFNFLGMKFFVFKKLK